MRTGFEPRKTRKNTKKKTGRRPGLEFSDLCILSCNLVFFVVRPLPLFLLSSHRAADRSSTEGGNDPRGGLLLRIGFTFCC